MKIEKTFNEPNAIAREISKEDAIEYLERRGYYEPGTVDMICQVGSKSFLRTPWAFYDFIPEE